MGGICSRVSDEDQPKKRAKKRRVLEYEEWCEKWEEERKDADFHAGVLRLLRSNEVFRFVCGELEPWKCNRLFKYFEAADCLNVRFKENERCRRLVQFDAREEREEINRCSFEDPFSVECDCKDL
jgi:hypothetical protein